MKIGRIALLIAIMMMTTGMAFAADDLMKRAQTVFKPIPTNPPVMEGKPATPAKIELGKMLYFDPRLSSSALISCNTCHKNNSENNRDTSNTVRHIYCFMLLNKIIVVVTAKDNRYCCNLIIKHR
jgi:cytochrome c peroxidase